MKSKPLISNDLLEFIESGLSITVATRDGELQPNGAMAWAAQVDPDRAHLTVFLYEKAAESVLRELESHPEIAVLFEKPSNHHGCQIKGIFESTRAGRPAERAIVERQRAGFFADLDGLGIPSAMYAGWKFWPCRALYLRATQFFEQTPGPGAGEPLR